LVLGIEEKKQTWPTKASFTKEFQAASGQRWIHSVFFLKMNPGIVLPLKYELIGGLVW